MPAPRKPYRLDPHEHSLQFSGIPDLQNLFPSWHEQAACRDWDGTEFFQELPLRDQLHEGLRSPSTLIAVLTCAGCSVRRPCLQAALDPPVFETREDAHRGLLDHETPPRVFGVWAGSVEAERHALKDVATDDAVEALESTFEVRLEARIEAYLEARGQIHRRPNGKLGQRPVRKQDRRVDQLIAKRLLKTFQLGPGPGRGHKGPIALYAERHGVSRSTAWRRLRAA